MKFTKVTKENIGLINFRVNKFIQDHKCVSFYADWGWFPKALNKLGIPLFGKYKHVERTHTGYILSSVTKVRIEKDYGVVINIGRASSLSVKLGERIKITPTHMFVKGFDVCVNKPYKSYFSPSNNFEKADNEIQLEDQLYDAYVDDFEKEYAEKESKDENFEI